MRKFLPVLLCFTLACNLLTRSGAPTVTPTPPRLTPTTPAPALLPTALLPTAIFAPTVTASPAAVCPFQLRPDDVILHPEPALYSGDIVSLEVLADTACASWHEALVAVYLDSRANAPLSTTKVAAYGLGAREEATFTWIWDTAGRVGPQTLIVEAQPSGAPGSALQAPAVLTVTVNLLPADQRAQPEASTHWEQAESACCIFHYLSDTAAARDISKIEALADNGLAQAEAKLGVQHTKKIEFNMLSRLLGHGGFASSSISLTYMDRNPVGNNLLTIFTHEDTHLLDQQLTHVRPAFMAEGLAVYVAGGHFKPNENLPQRAAALLALGRYLPLTDLAENFYPSQHETGYLEGSAFITYLVNTYGWERFKQFYSSFKSGTDRQMLETALQANFGKSLSEEEADWLAYLKTLTVTPPQAEDLRLSVLLYDTLRRYQSQDDPAAHYLTAWVPETTEAIRRGIVADYVRHPASAENVALEAMLAQAEQALEAGNYTQAEALLSSVNAVLETHNLFFDPLAATYLQIVNSLSAAGYEAQTISLASDNNAATVTAVRDWPTLETFNLTRTSAGWQMASP